MPLFCAVRVKLTASCPSCITTADVSVVNEVVWSKPTSVNPLRLTYISLGEMTSGLACLLLNNTVLSALLYGLKYCLSMANCTTPPWVLIFSLSTSFSSTTGTPVKLKTLGGGVFDGKLDGTPLVLLALFGVWFALCWATGCTAILCCW